ncbi:cell division/cell wall cluster transcriptional repressor MraZ [Mycoplasma nasistruthionis]|nr:cell division/cell wall cluster transcriptional repressor MraZ [Mycoplasma nasistruthionis]
MGGSGMYGTHTRSIDDKKRVVLPPNFKEQLGETFYLSIGFDGHAELRSAQEFDLYKQNIENKSRFDSKVRVVARYIFGKTYEMKLDSQSRISIPKTVFEELSIVKEVVFVGVGSIVELWPKEKYQMLEAQFDAQTIADIAQLIQGKNE